MAVSTLRHVHPVCGPHCTVVRVVIVGSDDGRSGSHTFHTLSILGCFAKAMGYAR